ncbi:MAG: divergent polysaccharide deacetylase family protein [Paracoccaceae bacterium]
MAGSDAPVVLAPEGDAAASESAPAAAADSPADNETGTAAGTAPDADTATGTGSDMAEAPETGNAPAVTGEADGAMPEAETAEAAEPQPAAEPVTGDETGADAASAPVEPKEDTPKRGEAAEADLTAQANGTPLPETDRAPQMEPETDKEPMAAPDEPAAIPGTELVEKLPPAVPPAEDEEVAVPDGSDTGPDTAGDKAPGNALVAEPAPEPEPEPEPAPEIATIVAEPAPAPSTTTVAPAATPEPEPAPEPAPETGASSAEGVVTGRLPTIGGDTAEPAPEVAAEAAEPLDPNALPAIERNAIEFAVEGDQPLLALILLDSGDRAALEDIGKLPFPLTVAVDASAPDAAEAVAFYDSRGIEVALILPLPAGATPTDVDTTVQAYRPLLDDAAEVVVDAGLEFQALGAGAVQLATNLQESGHGLVSFPSGLNTGHKSAVKLGVPAGLVFLDLDGDGQEGPVIRRFLDNAAFRARNENGVIVLARTRAETLQALLEWSLGNRAQSVTLAPISAVLQAQ